MAVTNTSTYATGVGNGSATAFPFSFTAASADEVNVTVNGASASHTVALASNGGTVTFDTAPANGAAVLIESSPAFTHTDAFANEGAFQPATLDKVHDRLTTYALWLRSRVAALFPFSLSDGTTRAGKFLGFDGSGNGVLLSGTGNDSAFRTDLAANTGFTLIKHKRGETGTYARTAAQLSKIGGFESGDGAVSVHHWIDPSLDDAIIARGNGTDLRAMIQSALDHAPLGWTLGFLDADYRVTGSLVQTRYLNWRGSNATRIQGLLTGTTDNLVEVRVATDAYGGTGDARRLSIEGIHFYLATNGASAFLLDVTGVGAIPNLYGSFDRVQFNSSNAVAAHIKGLTTQAHRFSNCEFTNGLHLDGSADGSVIEESVFDGDLGLILNLAGGAFQTSVVGNLMVNTGNAITVINGSQINIERNQIEMPGPCTASIKAHILITPQNYIAKKIVLDNNNFGAGLNLDYAIVAQSSGSGSTARIIDGLLIDRNTFNITTTGIDIALNDAGVHWTRIGSSNELRGNRGGVTIDANGFASANTVDPRNILAVTDTGTGTYGLEKAPTLNAAWSVNAGRAPAFRKTFDNILHLSGVVGGGAVNDVLFTLPVGFRPAAQTTRIVSCAGGVGSLRFDTNGDVVVTAMPSGPIDLGTSLSIKGRNSYDPGP